MRQTVDSIDNDAIGALLTAEDKKKEFVRLVVHEGLTYTQATKTMGYRSAGAAGSFFNDPNVCQAIQIEIANLLKFSDAPLARRVLLEIMTDVHASKSVRMECAKTVLNRAGYVEQRAAIAVVSGVQKAPCEMSGDELQREINRLQSEIGQRATGAKIIDAKPLNPQVIDILE